MRGNLVSKPGVLYGMRLPDEAEYRYVGISVALPNRIRAHRRNARNGMDLPVYRWMRKHGVDAVVFDILSEYPDRPSLLAAEVSAIEKLRSTGAMLLNMTNGGDGGAGYRHTEEHKAKLRALPPESRNTTGLKHDLEHMKKMSMLAAQSWTPERRAAASERMRKRVNTPERNAKVAAAKREYWARWHAERDAALAS